MVCLGGYEENEEQVELFIINMMHDGCAVFRVSNYQWTQTHVKNSNFCNIFNQNYIYIEKNLNNRNFCNTFNKIIYLEIILSNCNSHFSKYFESSIKYKNIYAHYTKKVLSIFRDI